MNFWCFLRGPPGGPRHDADLTHLPLGTGNTQNDHGFLHGSQNVDFDTPYSFFFFGFLSLCYGAVGDAAGSNTLTRNRPRFY